MVFVDDAHLLDNGSAILLHHLALTRAATVLATVRSGEAARAPESGRAPPVPGVPEDAVAPSRSPRER